MLRPAASEDFDPERTREDVGAATLTLDAERLGRGSILAGKYRLEMLLGEGGMACVWSAYHLELELPVAIKLLKAGPKNEKLAKRLRLEARAAARLAHPSIVRVLDVAAADNGDPFIVMELLSGESLAQVLARERLSSVRAVQLLLPIAEALAVAHAHGIVHRDLKPGNVFLSKEGQELQPKLLDFGIAKMEYASLVKLTDKGTILGSPNYMSPEQVRGDDVEARYQTAGATGPSAAAGVVTSTPHATGAQSTPTRREPRIRRKVASSEDQSEQAMWGRGSLYIDYTYRLRSVAAQAHRPC